MTSLASLQALVAVADAATMTDAAAALHVTQPTLSYRIATLERDLGGAVVDRRPGGRLTPLGADVLGPARSAVAAAQEVVDRGRAIAAGRAGRLRIGCAESLTGSVLAPLLTGWTRHHDGHEVVVDVREVSSADAALHLLDTDEIDTALLPGPHDRGAAVVHVDDEEFVVVAMTGHRLSTFDAVPWSELARVPIVHHHGGAGLAVTVDERAVRERVTLDVVARARTATSVAALAAAGIGVAIVPRTAADHLPDATIRPLLPAWTRPIELVRSPTPSPLALSFAQYVSTTAT